MLDAGRQYRVKNMVALKNSLDLALKQPLKNNLFFY